ncbi:chemotaxis protein CheB [Cupriavidus sp. 8B]
MSDTSLAIPDTSSPSFPIVGIGASAGGLEAISELLVAMSAAGGAAFLVVQHLDPSRHSLLPEILSSHTDMVVLEGSEGMSIDAGHVYVIPPNARMLVDQRRIRLLPREAALGPPMPVDDLFDSLATDQGAHAIGVVLSGSGSDGALGLRAIQREGGITFAQDEQSARFASMPNAAIGTGCVDFVMSPRQIAEEIKRIADKPHVSSGSDLDDSRPEHPAGRGLRHVFRLLYNACGIDFTHYKRGTVERRLSRRMALRQISSLADYSQVLESDPSESLALGRDLLIRVTEFFRDPDAFEALVQTVFPRILGERNANVPIRIWVPGCASGEEVYSVAMCLVEYLGERVASTPIQIFGTDVSLDALETARAGRYIENIARNVSAERLKRFFVRDGDHYRIDKSLRDLCTFARHNIAADPPFSRMDLVSCRNLLIYLDPVLQRNVIPVFHYALRAEGVLMLGPSETVGAFSEYFGVLENKRARLYIRKPRPDRLRSGVSSGVATPESSEGVAQMTADKREPTSGARLRQEADRKALARYAPPSVLCDEDLNIVEYRGDTSAWLVNPDGPPSSNLQRLAKPEVFLAVTEAVKQVLQEGVAVRKSGLDAAGGTASETSLEVHPVQIAGTDGKWFLVFFGDVQSRSALMPAAAPGPFKAWMLEALQKGIGQKAVHSPGDKDGQIARLTAELNATRERLRATLEEHESAREELKSSEEELLSSNEEFRSTNEELETAKEELQSINEELSTTNDELRYRVRELKALHEEMTRARDYAEAIIETIADPVVVLDAELRIVRANSALYQTFSTTAETTVGMRFYAIGDGQWDIPALRELLEDILPQRRVVRDYQITHLFPRVGVRTMRVNALRIAWPAQALILLTIQDVTQQRDDMARLEDADRQKDEFLAMLAHELRNPLAAIRNGFQIWKSGVADEATIKSAQAAVHRQLEHEIGLVDDLLDVSRITRGIISLRSRLVDLGVAVRHAAESLRANAAARQHRLTLSIPDEPLVVNGDVMRLEQIVNNLLGNAIKYTPAQGEVQLVLERQGEEAVLTVIDSGIGMEAAFIPNIFRIFVQAEPSLDRRSAGLGLGLALVKRLVELHQGSVRASSEGRGRGSKFVVRLPVLPQGTPADPPSEGDRGDTVEVPSQRILVVDDNADGAQSSAALLSLYGHEVQVAEDGETALSYLRSFRPDVVLLDIGLPGMDGYEVAHRIRSMPEHRHVLLVALSGYGQAEHRHRSRDAGFDHYLVKPADLRELNTFIASWRHSREEGSAPSRSSPPAS